MNHASLGRTTIHGELLKLRVTVSQATVSTGPASTIAVAAGRTSLNNDAKDLIALDLHGGPRPRIACFGLWC